ncbi:AAA family ATPase [Pseudoscardovia radai]|uniref:AAA family ATPase n=1 Tax=Pseudoscardovia radai TaxID=987066 RepID=UPI003994FFAD
MYVKELTLRGFKSFANPTTLRFEPGVTAIIGPNGSGKSNIVDALAWVMGEQGAKSLRGTSMEDVIFAGTSTRPPLGRAQVSLTIDNSDGTLDIDYSEVTISRTIYRNGGSEYAINGSAVRLLDVQELLSDTGLGSHMHVVVGQGRLDSILRATPADNRAFIEEAAGILKHRKRKERALRKLQNTQENLDRLDDLLKEIHRQLGPLRRQARVSRRADSIHVTLRDAQCRLYADDAAQLAARRDEERTQLASVREQLVERRRELADTKAHIDRLEALTSQSSPLLRTLNQQWHRLAQTGERLESLARLAEERASSFESRIQEVGGEDPDMLERRAEELEAQGREKESDTAALKLTLEKTTESRAEAEKQLASLRQTLTELRRTAQEREARMGKLRERIAREEALAQSDAQRRADLDTQRATYDQQLTEARERLDALRAEADGITGDDGAAALDEARTAADTARAMRDSLAQEQRRLDGEAISMQAKADALRDTLNSRDDALDLTQEAGLDTLGRLSDLISVADGWENGIASALGPFSGAVIVPGRDDVLAALTAVGEKSGTAAVLVAGNGAYGGTPADGSDGAHGGSDGAPVDDADEAGIRPAAALIVANPHAADPALAAGVIASLGVLLSDVAAVDTLDDARCALNDARYAQAVTRDGQILTSVGGYGGNGAAPSDLALASRRDKALARHAELVAQRDEAGARLETAQREYADARAALDAAKARVTERRVKAQEAKRAVESANTSVTSLERRVEDLRHRIGQLDGEAEERKRTIASLEDDLDAVTSAQGDDLDFDDVQAREKQLESQLDAQREAEITARLEWSDSDRHTQSLVRQAAMLRDNARQARIRRERIAEQNERLRDQAAQATHIAGLARQAAHRLGGVVSAVDAERDRVQSEASAHDGELSTLRAERNRLEPIVSALQNDEHDRDVLRERLATEYGALEQKVADALGLDIPTLVADFGPDLPVPVLDDEGRPIPLDDADDTPDLFGVSGVPDAFGDGAGESTGSGDDAADNTDDGTDGGTDGGADDASGRIDLTRVRTVPYVREEQEKRLKKARRDLEALGKVNPLAGEEYDALDKRNKYINEQRRDVVSSRDDLLQLIKDLDTTMVDVFQSAFDDTAAAFEKVFATLFPGGTGRLRLEDPDDLLGTGVIVEASPAGKRVKQLSLLSGGERSLTALALLFAIFTARPSPFYIMDEVEAALDDVNLTRLLNAIDDLREHAQLIIITHQQRTMSIADALYGVTMRADGVTSVVSTKMERGKGPDGANDASGTGDANGTDGA